MGIRISGWTGIQSQKLGRATQESSYNACYAHQVSRQASNVMFYYYLCQAKDALRRDSATFGFRLTKELEDQADGVRRRCRALTLMVHQHRHLHKVLHASEQERAAAKTKSAEAMTVHNANFSDVDTELLSPVLEQGVKDKILS